MRDLRSGMANWMAFARELPAYAVVEHRAQLRLAFESGPVLAVQLHELRREPGNVAMVVRE